MTSAFGWLDSDPEQRRRMLEVVDLFREQGTLDELGIGSIRDALSNAMFPGTSEIQTRLRYVLFVPWLLQRAAREDSPARMGAQFRKLEYRMIDALLAGGEQRGVIGNTARGNLKRMPSVVFWSALTAWGIHTAGFSAEGFFRRAADYRNLARHVAHADDPAAREVLPGTGIDPHLPAAPADLLRSATLTLTAEEEAYLSDRIVTSARGSMLAWLVANPPGNSPEYVWGVDNLGAAPADLAGLVDHARRFHTAIDGAGLVYHLLLARKSRREEDTAAYEAELTSWQDELASSDVLPGWDRIDWWSTIRTRNPRLGRPTIDFVDAWLDLIGSQANLAGSRAAAELINARERRMKGSRARLANQAALDRWDGGGGRFDLRYRWLVNRSHLRDLYSARAAS
jgi:hypothetical protein